MSRRPVEGGFSQGSELFEIAEEGGDGGPTGESRGDPTVGEGVNRHRVVSHQGDETEGRGETLRLVQLGSDTHGRRGVDHQTHRHLVVGFEELHQDLIEACHYVVVDAPEVVARVILAEVGEVDGVAEALRDVLPTEPPHQPVPALELKSLQPGHQLRAEEAHGVPRISDLGSGVAPNTSSIRTSASTPSAVAS